MKEMITADKKKWNLDLLAGFWSESGATNSENGEKNRPILNQSDDGHC